MITPAPRAWDCESGLHLLELRLVDSVIDSVIDSDSARLR